MVICDPWKGPLRLSYAFFVFWFLSLLVHANTGSKSDKVQCCIVFFILTLPAVAIAFSYTFNEEKVISDDNKYLSILGLLLSVIGVGYVGADLIGQRKVLRFGTENRKF